MYFYSTKRLYLININVFFFVRSEKLKPFWLSISDEDLSILHSLSDALLSRDTCHEYREAVNRALHIHDCKVLPFFGTFLQDLCGILSSVPGIIVFGAAGGQTLDVK